MNFGMLWILSGGDEAHVDARTNLDLDFCTTLVQVLLSWHALVFDQLPHSQIAQPL